MLDSMTNMLAKHQPGEIDAAPLNAIKNKSEIVFATIPNINKLEQLLEIQDEDQELAKSKKKIE